MNKMSITAVSSVAALLVAVGAAQADDFSGTTFNIIDNTVNSGTAAVSGMGTLTNVTLSMTLSHTYMSDLMFVLTAPNGTQVIFAHAAGDYNDLGGTYIISDAGSVSFNFPITSGGSVVPGTYSPATPFSAFNGIDPNGTWTLDIHDQYTFDEGAVSAWSLSIVPTPSAAAALGFAGLASLRRRR